MVLGVVAMVDIVVVVVVNEERRWAVEEAGDICRHTLFC
jgi:hypothetical protein